jgi:hypothetical protein
MLSSLAAPHVSVWEGQSLRREKGKKKLLESETFPRIL